MKKTAYLLLSVLCFGLVSCEDYLDTDSASYLSPDIVYNSIAYTDQAILGIYAQLPQDQIYGSRLQFTYGSGSDCDTYGTSILRIRRIPVWQIITGLLIIQLFLKNGMQFIRR